MTSDKEGRGTRKAVLFSRGGIASNFRVAVFILMGFWAWAKKVARKTASAVSKAVKKGWSVTKSVAKKIAPFVRAANTYVQQIGSKMGAKGAAFAGGFNAFTGATNVIADPKSAESRAIYSKLAERAIGSGGEGAKEANAIISNIITRGMAEKARSGRPITEELAQNDPKMKDAIQAMKQRTATTMSTQNDLLNAQQNAVHAKTHVDPNFLNHIGVPNPTRRDLGAGSAQAEMRLGADKRTWSPTVPRMGADKRTWSPTAPQASTNPANTTAQQQAGRDKRPPEVKRYREWGDRLCTSF
jgi:alpha-D-ribose 1-methylphosphonate 5-triphosphate synthase subunit PhnG